LETIAAMIATGAEITIERLQTLLDYWQSRLFLRDWDIKIELVRMSQMTSEECQGTCNFKVRNKAAFIQILSPIDYIDKRWVQDVERTLVHELLHLHFGPLHLPDEWSINNAEEQAINSIAKALIEEHRRADHDHDAPAEFRGAACSRVASLDQENGITRQGQGERRGGARGKRDHTYIARDT
jgi:hypothetical protein